MVMPRVLVELLQHSALLRGAIHSEQPPLLPLCSLHALLARVSPLAASST
jgi:hypothetical protein